MWRTGTSGFRGISGRPGSLAWRGGTVHTSADGDAGWTATGRVPGQPEAIIAHGAEVYVATDSGIYRSADNGATFALLQPLA